MSNEKLEFAYIHVHTRYSIKDSFVNVSDYVKKIHAYNGSTDSQYQIVGLSITEHGNMHSLVKHYNATKDPDKLGHRINPIYGCEVYHTDRRDVNSDKRYHLVLLAKNQKGLENLYQLVSDAGVHSVKSRAGNMFPLSEEAAFKKFGEGLIATSACLGGIIPKLLIGEEVKVDKNTKVTIPPDFEKAKQKALEYQSYFDEFYLEVQPHSVPEQLLLNAELVRLSEETGIPLVMGVDSHYVNSEDKQYHDILKDISNYPRYETNNYLFTPEEMYEFCIEHDIPLEAMSNTAKISKQCSVDPKPKNSRGLLPEFPVPVGYTEDGYLRELCNQSLIHRVVRNQVTDVQTYINRLNYELEVICGAGFAGYFLILWDWFKWCRQNDILMGKGRGSAAGSLVSYVLDITTLDPIKNGLIFER